MNRRWMIPLFIICLAALIGSAFGQDQNRATGQPPGQDPRGGRGQRPGGAMFDPNRNAVRLIRQMIRDKELNISKPQLEQLKQVLRDHPAFSEAQEQKQEEALTAKRQAFFEVTGSGQFDPAAARQLAAEIAKLQAGQLIEYAQLRVALLSLLTPEQQAKFNGKLAEIKKQQEQRAEQFRNRRPEGPGSQPPATPPPRR